MYKTPNQFDVLMGALYGYAAGLLVEINLGQPLPDKLLAVLNAGAPIDGQVLIEVLKIIVPPLFSFLGGLIHSRHNNRPRKKETEALDQPLTDTLNQPIKTTN